MTTNTTEYYQLSQFPKIEDRNTILNETTDDNKKIDKALRNHHNRIVVLEEDKLKIHSSINSITEKLNTDETQIEANKRAITDINNMSDGTTILNKKISDIDGRVTTLEENPGTTVDTTKFATKEELNALEIMAREQQCINGARQKGIEWDIVELMNLVGDGQFDKFAIGDYFVDPALNQEFAIVAKNHYPAWAFDSSTKVNHIVCCPFTPLTIRKHYYHYKPDDVLSYTETNTGGYAASNLAENLANDFNRLSPYTRSYCVQTKIFENNKGAWAARKRWMRLPTVMEITGDRGWASTEGFSNGVCGQLPLFKSALFRILDDDWYWTADPSSFDTTDFCAISSDGSCTIKHASEVGSVRPILVLRRPDQ